MPLSSRPIYVIRPQEQRYCGLSFTPYYYKEELIEKGLE